MINISDAVPGKAWDKGNSSRITKGKKDIKQFPKSLEMLCGDAYFLFHQNLAELKDNIVSSRWHSLIQRKNRFLGDKWKLAIPI